jgi:hypothetical protein
MASATYPSHSLRSSRSEDLRWTLAVPRVLKGPRVRGASLGPLEPPSPGLVEGGLVERGPWTIRSTLGTNARGTLVSLWLPSRCLHSSQSSFPFRFCLTR